MNEALISGLLGAIMGGSSSIEKSIAEEEAAKRKEEEEKRREERAFTLAERKADAEQKRKQALDEQERARVSKMLGPETRMTPAASPTEPEGIVESQIPIEERLQAGMQKAMSEGDTKTAKALLEQYQGLEEVKRKAAEEARKLAKDEKPDAEKLPERARNMEYLAKKLYKGPVDEKGNPTDFEAYAKSEKQAMDLIFREPRPAGSAGTPGQRPPTAGQEMSAQFKIGARMQSAFTEGSGDKKKVNQDLASRAESIAIELIDNSEPGKKIDVLKIQNNAVEQVRNARRKAEEQVGAQWDAMKDKGGVTRSRYIERNYMSYIDDYLGKPQEPAAPSAGAPWTRSWRQ